MNRAERRKAVRDLQKRGIKREAAELFISVKDAASKPSELFLQEGEKVRLNVEAIKSHPDWHKKTTMYRNFVVENAETVFTVEYDPHYRDNPTLVCLAEDESKWLWFEGHLEKVGDSN